MLDAIKSLPDDVIGYSAKGMVTKNDYRDTLGPDVKKMFDRYKKIKMIYHLGIEFKGFNSDAMWEDSKLGLKYFSSWHKIAIVTDHFLIARFAWFTGLFIPGEIRIFTNLHFEKALRWINE
jgi:stage II sporulation SpoAA-like protein